MSQEFQIKTFISEIEAKLDKNSHPFYKLSLAGCADYCYAFSNSLNAETLSTLAEAPHNFINRQVLITYQELPNKDNLGTFRKVKQIEIV